MKRPVSPDSSEQGAPSKKRAKATLEELIDLSGISGQEQLLQRFATIAETLCNETRLCLYTDASSPRVEYFIAEIEFYLITDGHADPFCHGADGQKHSGTWYFHRAPSRSPTNASSAKSTVAGGFRGGTRKGLDLAFGGTGAVGGILLRAVRRVSDDLLVAGPSRLVDEVLTQNKKKNIAELVASWTTLEAFHSNPTGPCMALVPADSPKLKVHSSPRVGLDLSHKTATASADDARVQFVTRSYRFFVRPDTLTANGRMQTFAGLYESCSADVEPSRAVAKVCSTMNLKPPTGDDYARAYRTGVKAGDVKKFIGTRTTSPTAYLEMVGAIHVFLQSKSMSDINVGGEVMV